MNKRILFLFIILSVFASVWYWDNPISVFNREGFPITLDFFKTKVKFWKLEGGAPVEESIHGVFEISANYYNYLLSKCNISTLDKKKFNKIISYNEDYEKKIGLSIENTDCVLIKKMEMVKYVYATFVRKGKRHYIKYRVVD